MKVCGEEFKLDLLTNVCLKSAPKRYHLNFVINFVWFGVYIYIIYVCLSRFNVIKAEDQKKRYHLTTITSHTRILLLSLSVSTLALSLFPFLFFLSFSLYVVANISSRHYEEKKNKTLSPLIEYWAVALQKKV